MIVNEIFQSIAGEVCSFHQGSLTTFIRFAGCNLDCEYCDTLYARGFENGINLTTKKIKNICDKAGITNITITGGEPLLQPHMKNLILLLLKSGYKISVETNGSIPVEPFLKPVPAKLKYNLSFVIDYKSDQREKMHMYNYSHARQNDWVKFMIRNSDDYTNAISIAFHHMPNGRLAMSPIEDDLQPQTLVGWLLDDGVDAATVNIQMHKYIWPDGDEGTKVL